jgi:hypothetical protein
MRTQVLPIHGRPAESYLPGVIPERFYRLTTFILIQIQSVTKNINTVIL